MIGAGNARSIFCDEIRAFAVPRHLGQRYARVAALLSGNASGSSRSSGPCQVSVMIINRDIDSRPMNPLGRAGFFDRGGHCPTVERDSGEA